MCVYDQSYALVILTQQKKEELEIRLERKTNFSFLVQLYKTIYVWVYAVLEH